MIGLSTLLREQTERDAAARLARAVQLEALDGVMSFARREQLAERLEDEEVALLAHLATDNRSVHTLRALAGDLETLALWHRRNRTGPLPFPPSEAFVLDFIADQQSASSPPLSHATLKRRITSWATLARAAGGSDAVFSLSAIRAALAGQAPVRAKAEKLGEEGVARLLAACDNDSLTDCRDRALLMTAFSLDLRPAEIAALRVEHLSGGKKPRLRCDEGKGAAALPLPAPVFAALSHWRKRAKLGDGPLFRPVDRWGKPGRLGLTPQSVTLIVRARAKAAGLDPAAFSARSLR